MGVGETDGEEILEVDGAPGADGAGKGDEGVRPSGVRV